MDICILNFREDHEAGMEQSHQYFFALAIKYNSVISSI